MTPPASPLLIVGASVRAAAASALRAGFQPICADHFGDEDLRRMASVLVVGDDRRSLLKAIESLPPCPWIYTGSVENDLHLVAAVSRRHRLLGNSPDVLKKVRDPFWLEKRLRARDLPALCVLPVADPPLISPQVSPDEAVVGRLQLGQSSAAAAWLLKPTRSGGGQRITGWAGQPIPKVDRCYFQERRLGRPMSALFVAQKGRAQIVGVCEQLIGLAAGAPSEFGYAGSIGPIEVQRSTHDLLQRLGDTLTQDADLRGLFGIDFILAEDVPWLVEVNPRYTASVEVLERATGASLLASHVAACESRVAMVGERAESSCSMRPIFGKQIVYATESFVAPRLEELFHTECLQPESPLIADLPAKGSQIAAGSPICTVFAEGSDIEECRRLLDLRSRRIIGATRPLIGATRPLIGATRPRIGA